jgi:hypothetical protein
MHQVQSRAVEENQEIGEGSMIGIVNHGSDRYEVQSNGKRLAVFDDLADAELFVKARQGLAAADALAVALEELAEKIEEEDYLSPSDDLPPILAILRQYREVRND